jgi:glucose-6-phosphate 1-dehydrogenase
MLQLLMMAAVHLPKNSTSQEVRYKKKQLMESLVPLAKQDVGSRIIRGQYTAGTVLGEEVAGYRSEPNIPETSMNDTFIAAKLQIDNVFWRDVPFYIRTGKRMKEKATRIVIEFKDPVKQNSAAYEASNLPNLLVFEIGPNEGITLQLNTRDTLHKGEFKPMQLNFLSNGSDAPEAYENLISDALHGDPTFFAHWDEVELSWKWVQPILEAFQENLVPLHSYAAGTFGPEASDQLLAQDGFHWWFDTKSEQETATSKGEDYAYHTNN